MPTKTTWGVNYNTEAMASEIDRLQTKVSRLQGALERANRECQNMHHRKSEYHQHDEPCPVEAIISTAMTTDPVDEQQNLRIALIAAQAENWRLRKEYTKLAEIARSIPHSSYCHVYDESRCNCEVSEIDAVIAAAAALEPTHAN